MISTLSLPSFIYSKSESFDPAPIIAAWPKPPRFQGIPRRDPPVDDWLTSVRAGCEERKIPQEHWPAVAQQLLGKRASQRLADLQAVSEKVQGSGFRLNWKQFCAAMRNMGWDISESKTQNIQIATKDKGSWWWSIGTGNAQAEGALTADNTTSSLKQKKRISGFQKTLSSKMKKNDGTAMKGEGQDPALAPSRLSGWLTRSRSDGGSIDSTAEQKSSIWNKLTPSSTPFIPPAHMKNDATTVTVAAPLWLMNATGTLDFLNVEHPKTMSAVAAVLITVGSLPALPGLAGVAGGAVLASHTVQTAGVIAVGVGNWLKSSQDAATQRAQAAGASK